ncbi:MAG: hypothetical protein KAQ99_05500 [Candidatus Aureabacteria bacterium]|nr:hypothetical protein [Candidatus Auribacterota bacterium]
MLTVIVIICLTYFCELVFYSLFSFALLLFTCKDGDKTPKYMYKTVFSMTFLYYFITGYLWSILVSRLSITLRVINAHSAVYKILKFMDMNPEAFSLSKVVSFDIFSVLLDIGLIILGLLIGKILANTFLKNRK